MKTLVLLLAACFLQGGEAPNPGRDLQLTLVLTTPARTHAWWPIVVEAWVENHSNKPVPIVREMDGSWDGRVEPALAWRGTLTAADGRVAALPAGSSGAVCGNYDSNWVGGILVVPPGGRQRIFSRDIRGLACAGTGCNRWLSGKAELRLEYEYKGRPSRPTQWEGEPREEEKRFGAFARVAPFRMQSNALMFELVPPAVSPDELDRDLVLELELQNDGHVFTWEVPRGRAHIRNVSARSYRIARPGLGCLGLVRPGFWVTGGENREWRDPAFELGPGEELVLPFERSYLDDQWQDVGPLELAYCWIGGGPALANADLAEVPPFELRTAARRIVRENPLIVELVPLAPVPSGRRYRLTEILELVLQNTGDTPLELASAEQPLRIDLDSPDGLSHLFEVSKPLALPPHSERSLTADRELGIDGWNYDASNGAVPRTRGQATIQRKGWARAVSSRQVTFEMR